MRSLAQTLTFKLRLKVMVVLVGSFSLMSLIWLCIVPCTILESLSCIILCFWTKKLMSDLSRILALLLISYCTCNCLTVFIWSTQTVAAPFHPFNPHTDKLAFPKFLMGYLKWPSGTSVFFLIIIIVLIVLEINELQRDCKVQDYKVCLQVCHCHLL